MWNPQSEFDSTADSHHLTFGGAFSPVVRFPGLPPQPPPRLLRRGRVSVGPIAQVWLIAPDGQAYIRQNASVSNPIGTKWRLVKGPLLQQICVGHDLVWATDVLGSILYRRDVSSYKPQGKSWDAIAPPSQSSCTCVAATPQPNLVQLINKAGGVFHRVGVSRATPQGTAWMALNFNGLRMKLICCAGAIPREQMELQRQSW